MAARPKPSPTIKPRGKGRGPRPLDPVSRAKRRGRRAIKRKRRTSR